MIYKMNILQIRLNEVSSTSPFVSDFTPGSLCLSLIILSVAKGKVMHSYLYFVVLPYLNILWLVSVMLHRIDL